jgi:hypothetical protein
VIPTLDNAVGPDQEWGEEQNPLLTRDWGKVNRAFPSDEDIVQNFAPSGQSFFDAIIPDDFASVSAAVTALAPTLGRTITIGIRPGQNTTESAITFTQGVVLVALTHLNDSLPGGAPVIGSNAPVWTGGLTLDFVGYGVQVLATLSSWETVSIINGQVRLGAGTTSNLRAYDSQVICTQSAIAANRTKIDITCLLVGSDMSTNPGGAGTFTDIAEWYAVDSTISGRYEMADPTVNTNKWLFANCVFKNSPVFQGGTVSASTQAHRINIRGCSWNGTLLLDFWDEITISGCVLNQPLGTTALISIPSITTDAGGRRCIIIENNILVSSTTTLNINAAGIQSVICRGNRFSGTGTLTISIHTTTGSIIFADNIINTTTAAALTAGRIVQHDNIYGATG